MIINDDEMQKNSKIQKEDNDIFTRKSNSSLKALRNEKVSQSLKVNKISDIDNISQNNIEKEEEEYNSQLYENEKRDGRNDNKRNYSEDNDNEDYNQFENGENDYNNPNLNYFNNNNQNNKYNYYNEDINVIEEEKSKKDEDIDLDDIDENIDFMQNVKLENKENNYDYEDNNYNDSKKIRGNNSYKNINDTNMNKNNLALHNMKNKNSEKLIRLEDEDDENNQIEEQNENENDNALSDLDKEEYYMKSCYEFFDYDITTLAERKVIEDSHPIRTSCFSSKGDYFAIGTNSKSIKLFHIKPILQRFNKRNSYNYKNEYSNQNQMQYNNYNNQLNYNNLSSQNFNDLDDIKMVFEQTNHHLGSIYCLDWSVSGRLIASGSNDRLIKLMVVPSLDDSYIKDPETLELTISGHEGTIRSVSFEPTNDLILLSGGICNNLFL